MAKDWTAVNALFLKHAIAPPLAGCGCGECCNTITPFELDIINTAIVTLRRHGIEVTMTRRCATPPAATDDPLYTAMVDDGLILRDAPALSAPMSESAVRFPGPQEGTS
jgi:hypothetical protein